MDWPASLTNYQIFGTKIVSRDRPGGAIITWTDSTITGWPLDIHAQRISSVWFPSLGQANGVPVCTHSWIVLTQR